MNYSRIIVCPYHVQQQELARFCPVMEDIWGEHVSRHGDAVKRRVIQRGANLPLDIQQPNVE